MISGSKPTALPYKECSSSSSMVSVQLCLFGKFSRQYLRKLKPWNSALKTIQSPRVRWKRAGDQLQKHKLLPFTTQGANTPTVVTTTRQLILLQSSDRCSCCGRALMLIWHRSIISFYSCRNHRHWIWLDSVHKTLSEKNDEGIMLTVHRGQAYKLCISNRPRDFSLFFF